MLSVEKRRERERERARCLQTACVRKSCGGSSSSHLLSHYTFPCIDIGPRELAAAKAQQDQAVDQSAQRQQRSKWSDPFAALDDAANAAAVLDNQATFKYRKRGTHTHTHSQPSGSLIALLNDATAKKEISLLRTSSIKLNLHLNHQLSQ